MHEVFLIVIIISQPLFAQHPVDTTVIVHINGIRQYVRIKGKDISKPLLLFLHGGPGGSLMQKFDKVSSKLQDHFVVVHWDQRQTGETLKLNKTKEPLTLQLFYNDTHDLVDSLLRQFSKPKLYLVGYSWGSGLGKHAGQKLVSLSLPKSFVETWGAAWFDVFSRATEVDLLQTLPVIKCPVYFFAGAKDYNTNSSITTEYYSKVSAPKKDLFLFNDAGHELLVTHSDGFQDMIIRKILPQDF